MQLSVNTVDGILLTYMLICVSQTFFLKKERKKKKKKTLSNVNVLLIGSSFFAILLTLKVFHECLYHTDVVDLINRNTLHENKQLVFVC